MYITTEDQLKRFCEQIEKCQWLAIDTEFVREKSYFHHLGLLQVAGNGNCAAIDPIAVKDLTLLLNLLKKTTILKVFHAGKQDLEILYKLCGEQLRPVFDTQIAASLLGWGTQISFAKVVHKTTGKKIYKNETYTDWCRRPLSPSQIEYALDDVRYLVPVYENLLERLKKLNRLEWLQNEFKALEDADNYKSPDPREQYLRIKNIRGLRSKNLGVMIELAAWREGEAMRRDCHPKTIVRDEPLLEIARGLPKNLDQLGSIRGFHQKEISKSGQAILNAIQKGLELPKDQVPVLPETENYSTHPGVEELLAAYIQSRSEELKIEPTVLADRKQIHKVVKIYEQGGNLDGSLFNGWRNDLIGKTVRDILEGRLALSVDSKGKVQLIHTSNSKDII